MGSLLSCFNGGTTYEDSDLESWRRESERIPRVQSGVILINDPRRRPRNQKYAKHKPFRRPNRVIVPQNRKSPPIKLTYERNGITLSDNSTQTMYIVEKRTIGSQTIGLFEGCTCQVSENRPTEYQPINRLISLSEINETFRDDSEQIAEQSYLVTIPLNKRNVIARFNKLKKSIIESKQFDGKMFERLFCNPRTLHITISTLNIRTKKGIELAKRILENEFKKIDKFFFKLNLENLFIWDSDGGKNCRTVCVKVENDELQTIADNINSAFHQANLLTYNIKDFPYKKLTLHMTLINAKRTNYTAGDVLQDFDATDLMNEFKTFTFNNVILDDIQLSCSAITNHTGYYSSHYSYKDFRNQYSSNN